HGKKVGAGEGNRTLVCSLGSCRSTIELRPRRQGLSTAFAKCQASRGRAGDAAAWTAKSLRDDACAGIGGVPSGRPVPAKAKPPPGGEQGLLYKSRVGFGGLGGPRLLVTNEVMRDRAFARGRQIMFL